MKQPELFDPARTITVRCDVCGATRKPDEERAPDCRVDRDRDTYPRRPLGCLNTYDPATAAIPY